MATKDISVIRDKKTGDIKDIRDKKLADGTEQTTLSQSGTVQGWDANGNAIFIPRDSVLQILSEVINSNNQSTIGSLFGMGANNTPASINMANLASVLSAPGRLDTNDIDGLGERMCSGILQGYGSYVHFGGPYPIQIRKSVNNLAARPQMRIKFGTWQAWEEL